MPGCDHLLGIREKWGKYDVVTESCQQQKRGLALVTSDCFQARFSIAKLIIWISAAGLMVGMGVWMLLVSWDAGNLILAGLIALATSFFGAMALSLMVCLADRRIQLQIDAQGMFIRAHSDAVIDLRSLTGAQRHSRRVCFSLKKPEKYPIERLWRKFMYRINGAAAFGFFGHVWVWPSLYDCSSVDVLNAIHDYRQPTDYELEMRALGSSARSDVVPSRL